MDIERELLGAVVRDGNLKPLLEANIQVKDFKSADAVFDFIRTFYMDHGTVPTFETVDGDYPGALPETDPPEPLSYYVEEMVSELQFRLLYKGLSEAAGAIDEPDIARSEHVRLAIGTLAETIRSISETGGTLSAVDIADRGPSWWAGYIASEHQRTGIPPGRIPTGIPAIDHSMRGMRKENLITLFGLPKSGKAQPLGTPVLTPDGWTAMGGLEVGDLVVGSDGQPTAVTAIHPQGTVPVYRVLLDDGASTEACGDHLWQTLPHNKVPQVLSTTDMADLIAAGTDERQLYVPVVAPVAHAHNSALPVDPRLLGLLLGDGSFRWHLTFTSGDMALAAEVAARYSGPSTTVAKDNHWLVRLRNDTPETHTMRDTLRTLGLWHIKSGEKFIPAAYLTSSVDQRMALLRGLMDTDGGMNGKSACFYTSSLRLKDDVVALVRSLGGVVAVRRKTTSHRDAFNLSIRLPESLGAPFGLARKVAAWSADGTAKRPPTRRVVAVEYVGEKPAQCITVAAEDHLYVTQDYIVTHNSLMLLRMAIEAHKWGYRPMFISFEMSVEEQEERYHALRAAVSLTRMQQGRLRNAEKAKVERSMRYVSNLNRFIIAEDPQSMTTVSALAAHIDNHSPDVVYVDGTYMMEDELGEAPNSAQALTNITRALKRLAQAKKVPLAITTQALEWKTSKRDGVGTGSVGYSSSFLQDSDTLIGIDTPDAEEPQRKRYKVLATRVGTPVTATYDWDFERTGVLYEVEHAPDEDVFDGANI